MEQLLTGLGLSGSAGLNAYLPMLIMGVMARLDVMQLQDPYDKLSSPLILGILVILLIIEMTADKIPAVDNLNDAIQTFIRPSAGALLFTASTAGVDATDPTMLTAASLLGGGMSAGSVHTVKAISRPGVTLTTAGFGNFFVSIIEDIISFFVSIFAILIPFIVLILSFSMVVIVGWIFWDYHRIRTYFPSEQTIYRRLPRLLN